jgi:hypothetical protein
VFSSIGLPNGLCYCPAQPGSSASLRIPSTGDLLRPTAGKPQEPLRNLSYVSGAAAYKGPGLQELRSRRCFVSMFDSSFIAPFQKN